MLHSIASPEAGQKWIKIVLGLKFFNEIIGHNGRYLYMALVSIQIESVPTLNIFIVLICLRLSPKFQCLTFGDKIITVPL